MRGNLYLGPFSRIFALSFGSLTAPRIPVSPSPVGLCWHQRLARVASHLKSDVSLISCEVSLSLLCGFRWGDRDRNRIYQHSNISVHATCNMNPAPGPGGTRQQGGNLQGHHSPDSGTWVSFEDGIAARDLQGSGHVSPANVHIALPPPPRRGETPSYSTLSPPSHSLISLPTSIPAQERQELEEIDRVQRILQADSALHSVDIPSDHDDSQVVVRVGDGKENGHVLTTLRPSNDSCAWIAPPVYHPEMVPQKVADLLQVPLEDYVMNLDVLVRDFRFRLYVVLYKRLIAIWLLVTLIVLLSLLFSGLRGLSLFAAGLIWLIVAGGGMCTCLYGKKKISDGLRMAVAHANKFMVKQQLIIGVEDRGKLSLQKVVLPIIHYDVLPCLATIAQLLEQTKLVRAENGGGTVNVYMPSHLDMDAQDTTPMDKAEMLMLRCVQPYVKELVKKRLLFNITKVEDIEIDATRVTTDVNPQLFPRHCKTSWCLCQFVDRMVIRRKPRKWFRKIWSEDF